MADAPQPPLAERVRPAGLTGFSGQTHLLEDGPLAAVLNGGALHSMIFWGPPGTGKTTLARMLAGQHDARFVSLSAVMCGVKDVRAAVSAAQQDREQFGVRTVLFLDEVHRFNKSQQDAFLPYVEDGTLVFVGATTENPSFALNNALLSRARVYVLKSLDDKALVRILHAALEHPDAALRITSTTLPDDALSRIASAADGDARRALNFLEQLDALSSPAGAVEPSSLERVVEGGVRRFDRGGDDFYDLISALHKSVRGSNPDAATYYVARMLDGGCDPRYVVRRLIRIASEDIGNADPRALGVALDAARAFDRLGSPEGDLAIHHAAIFLACMAKSDAVYNASKAAAAAVQQHGSAPVPMHLRNAPTKLMDELGHGSGYRHAHLEDGAFAPGVDYLPEPLGQTVFYAPSNRGLEQRIGERLKDLRQQDKAARASRPEAKK
ncbi:MAG: replication-associated recombination protein A [Gammaproteobacteria bacterium]